MLVYVFLIVFILLGTVVPAYLHLLEHGQVSILQVLLAFFLILNVLICFWEIGLGLHITTIKIDYKNLSEKYGKQRLKAVVDLMNHRLQLQDIGSLLFWSRIWSTYSLYDPSYSNRESFGFFVDVGNGWTTLAPSLLFLYSMTYHELIGARLLGVIGMVSFYQEWYGTCIYFLSFFVNKRHVGKSVFEVVMFVGFSNGLWFVFPLIGMIASFTLIESNSYAIFH
jgi:hypothetical protein